MSGNEAWNRNVFRRWRKVDRDGADITLSGRLFQMVGPATGKARPPTVDSFTGGTSRLGQVFKLELHAMQFPRSKHFTDFTLISLKFSSNTLTYL